MRLGPAHAHGTGNGKTIILYLYSITMLYYYADDSEHIFRTCAWAARGTLVGPNIAAQPPFDGTFRRTFRVFENPPHDTAHGAAAAAE